MQSVENVVVVRQSAAVLGSLLELMLDSSLSDLRVAQGVALPFCPSLVRLLRLLQDFLFAEGTENHSLWSEKVDHIISLKPFYYWDFICGIWINTGDNNENKQLILIQNTQGRTVAL